MNDPKPLAYLDITQLIDDRALSRFQILVIALCGFIAMLDGFDTQAIAFVAPAIAVDIGADKSAFGPVFSAALVGLAVGAVSLGTLADSAGRRRVIIGCTVAFGLFSIATAYATSLNQIMVLRFLTGLGLGGAMPNIIALTTDYSPKRLRAVMVVIMFSGFPLGALLGGVVSSQLVILFGWPSIFIFGGVVPLLLVPVLFLLLPESPTFLISRNNAADRQRLATIVGKLGADLSVNAQTTFEVTEESSTKGSVRDLFADYRAVGTIMLWGVFFTNLLMFYFLISWLPTVLVDAGLPIRLAILTAVLLNAGAVFGGVTLGRLVDINGPFKILTINYLFAAFFAVMIGQWADQLYIVGGLVFCAGFCVGGGQLVANSLAATYYPSHIRSTGIGWAIGLGRIGAILGPILGGALVAVLTQTSDLFTAVAIPGLLASCAVFYMGRVSTNQ